MTLRERGENVIATVESLHLRPAEPSADSHGSPAERIHGPIDAQIKAAFRFGHGSDRSSLSVLPAASDAIAPISPIGISGLIAPDCSLQRVNAAALPGSEARVETVRRMTARVLRIV